MPTLPLTPRVGHCVVPDGWNIGSNLQPSTWNKAQFYLPVHSLGPIKEVAVNVQVIGRKVRTVDHRRVVRVAVTFVGDESPDTHHKGYLVVTDEDERNLQGMADQQRQYEEVTAEADLTNYYESIYS